MNLYNIKKIVLSGNEINKVATSYNPYNLHKDKTAISIKALEEAIDNYKGECNFEFGKQHETNMFFDELIVKDSNETEQSKYDSTHQANILFDITYNIKICYDPEEGKAYYPEDSLDYITSDKIYLAKTIKLFDQNISYEIDEGEDVVEYGQFIDRVDISSHEIIFDDSYNVYEVDYDVFKTSQGIISFSENKEFLTFYLDPECLNKITKNDVDIINEYEYDIEYTLKQNKNYYIKFELGSSYKIIYYNGPSDASDIIFKKFKAYISVGQPYNLILPKNDYVKVYRISNNLKNYNLNLTNTANNYPNYIYANNIDLNKNIIAGQLNPNFLFIDTTYKNLHTPIIKENLNVMMLVLSSKFFDNINLASATPGQFGDFANFNGTEIDFEYDGLYTSLDMDDDELIDLLRNLLNIDPGVQIRMFNSFSDDNLPE